MANIYWPVYKSIEREVTELMYSIHVDDQQLNVYSIRIADLILRTAVEIESISKDLYLSNNGSKADNIKYDEDAIKYLNQRWKLDSKVVIISSTNCFLSNRILNPFRKNEKRTGNERMTYGWNNAYQNLKHNRAKSLIYGSFRYLLEIMATLYVLNIYFKHETFDLEKDSNATTFPISLGSDLFSVCLHKWEKYSFDGKYNKNESFDECIYLTKIQDNSRMELDDAFQSMITKSNEIFYRHPKFIQYIQENDISSYSGGNLMRDVLGAEEELTILKQSGIDHLDRISKEVKYEAVINKNDI